MPGRGELKSVLEVGYLPSRFSGSDLPQRSSEHQGGALNIVRQAVAVGVKYVSFVGTVGAVIGLADPLVKAPLSDEDWNPLTEEFALSSGGGVLVYTIVKKQAEQSLWKFAEEQPELNLTTGTSRF